MVCCDRGGSSQGQNIQNYVFEPILRGGKIDPSKPRGGGERSNQLNPQASILNRPAPFLRLVCLPPGCSTSLSSFCFVPDGWSDAVQSVPQQKITQLRGKDEDVSRHMFQRYVGSPQETLLLMAPAFRGVWTHGTRGVSSDT